MKFLSITTTMIICTVLLNGYSLHEDNNRINNISSIEFSPIKISKNGIEKKTMRISKKLSVKYSDGTIKNYNLSYKNFLKMGDKIGLNTIGLMTNKNGDAIKKLDGSEDISTAPDGNSLINVEKKSYLITHMEETPGTIYKTEVKVQNGVLKAINTAPIDFSAMKGTMVDCASTKTTYGSHLGGEEDYELNSIYADKNSPFFIDCALDGSGSDTLGVLNKFCYSIDQMNKYLGTKDINKSNAYNGSEFMLYNYGYTVEVQPQADGTTKSTKHYVTGKYTPELALMMPNQKTIYMTDDGIAKGFWKFVSDHKIKKFKAEWSGTLYSAKVHQLSAVNGGSFNLKWIKLGHASDSEVKKMINAKMKLTDIFSITKPDKKGNCTTGFRKIYEDNKIECLNLKKGKEKEAAFLESRKYAAYKGATTEFIKEEGLTYNVDNNKLYMAMSTIEKSMEDNYKDLEPRNDIKLKKNSCGAVYALTLDSQYSATKMEAIVTGRPLNSTDMYADEWYCSPEKIANPDNLFYLGHNTLLISEDTTKHVNNMTWAYNTKTKKMTRIASLPIGAEVAGVDKGIVDNQGFLFLNIQHPFKDNPEAQDSSKPNSKLIEDATNEQLKAIIGYIDGIPAEVLR